MTASSEQQPSSHEIKVLSDQGSGRTFITIVDDEAYLPFATAVVEKLASKARTKAWSLTRTLAPTGPSSLTRNLLTFWRMRSYSAVGVRIAAARLPDSNVLSKSNAPGLFVIVAFFTF